MRRLVTLGLALALVMMSASPAFGATTQKGAVTAFAVSHAKLPDGSRAWHKVTFKPSGKAKFTCYTNAKTVSYSRSVPGPNTAWVKWNARALEGKWNDGFYTASPRTTLKYKTVKGSGGKKVRVITTIRFYSMQPRF